MKILILQKPLGSNLTLRVRSVQAMKILILQITQIPPVRMEGEE